MKPLFLLLKLHNRLNLLIILSISVLLSLSLITYRVYYTQSLFFVFLLWNLILAAIPYFISTFMILYKKYLRNRKFLFFPMIFIWFVFFPNAPYIITDLFHLKHKTIVPAWYDLILILTFAWNGIILGYLSLVDIQHIITEKYNSISGWIISIGVLLLSGFGIYVGRFLRWNSWDIISNPTNLANDIFDRLINPMQHSRTYGMTLIYGAFLIVMYVTSRMINADTKTTGN